MLASLKDVLSDARAGGYAVPAFDVVEDVMVRTILDTCERLRSPVVLMGLIGPDLSGRGWDYVPGLIQAVADRYDIPVVLHLDHATDLVSIERAVELGFTSVMLDGSALPFEENVAITRRAAELAHPSDVSLEGELGCVGGSDLEATRRIDSVLTEPDQVEAFVKQTGVDALAVSIGTSHGVYTSLPNLNIERLRELNAVSKVPLVLHGGSGTPEDQVRNAVRNGICKMNIYADCRIAVLKGLRESAGAQKRPDPTLQDMLGPIRNRLAEVVEQKVRLLFADGKA